MRVVGGWWNAQIWDECEILLIRRKHKILKKEMLFVAHNTQKLISDEFDVG